LQVKLTAEDSELEVGVLDWLAKELKKACCSIKTIFVRD